MKVSCSKKNKAALKKKLKVILNIVQGGIGTINSKSVKILEDQAEQLESYYLTYPQTILSEIITLII